MFFFQEPESTLWVPALVVFHSPEPEACGGARLLDEH